MNPHPNLGASVATMDQSLDLTALDQVVLGDPFCPLRHGNPMGVPKILESLPATHPESLAKIYLTTPVVPGETDLALLDRILDAADRLGVAGVEVHSPGVARQVRKRHPELKIIISPLGNIYTGATASIYLEVGCHEAILPYEASLDEAAAIASEGGLPIRIPVHGSFPLNFSRYCFFYPDPEGRPGKPPKDTTCDSPCTGSVQLDYGQDLVVYQRGRALYSARDLCMIEHLPLLLSRGFDHFRLEGLHAAPERLNAWIRIYRAALDLAADGKSSWKPGAETIRELQKFSPDGWCNGFHFARSGREYEGELDPGPWKAQSPGAPNVSGDTQTAP